MRLGLTSAEILICDAESAEIVEWRSITSLDKLINRNIKHFAQAKSTPLLEGVFGSFLNPFDQNKFPEFILNGEINLETFDVNYATKTCVLEMTYAPEDDSLNAMNATITLQDFKQVLKQFPKSLRPLQADATLGAPRPPSRMMNWVGCSYALVMSLRTLWV